MSATGSAPDRVLYVLSKYPVLSETFVRNEIAALRTAGVRVDVLTLRAGSTGDVPEGWAGPFEVARRPALGVVVSSLVWWALHHPVRLSKLVHLLLVLRGRDARLALTVLPSVLRPHIGVRSVHTHFGWRASAPCLFAGLLLAAPSSVTLHANDIYVPTDDLPRKLRRFDRLVTVCDYNVAVVRGLCGHDVDVFVVPCGVSVPVEPLAPVTGARVLSVGRLVPKKGFVDLVAAMAVVVAQRPDATLEIIGDGSGRLEVEELIERLHLTDAVTLSGSRPNGEVLDTMSSASVFALACAWEDDGGSDALPVVLREAMARGRPVVSTDVAGIPETLDGVGWVVPSGDVPALADALLEALEDTQEASRRGTAARERVSQHHTLRHTAEGMKRVFDMVGERN